MTYKTARPLLEREQRYGNLFSSYKYKKGLLRTLHTIRDIDEDCAYGFLDRLTNGSVNSVNIFRNMIDFYLEGTKTPEIVSNLIGLNEDELRDLYSLSSSRYEYALKHLKDYKDDFELFKQICERSVVLKQNCPENHSMYKNVEKIIEDLFEVCKTPEVRNLQKYEDLKPENIVKACESILRHSGTKEFVEEFALLADEVIENKKYGIADPNDAVRHTGLYISRTGSSRLTEIMLELRLGPEIDLSPEERRHIRNEFFRGSQFLSKQLAMWDILWDSRPERAERIEEFIKVRAEGFANAILMHPRLAGKILDTVVKYPRLSSLEYYNYVKKFEETQIRHDRWGFLKNLFREDDNIYIHEVSYLVKPERREFRENEPRQHVFIKERGKYRILYKSLNDSDPNSSTWKYAGIITKKFERPEERLDVDPDLGTYIEKMATIKKEELDSIEDLKSKLLEIVPQRKLKAFKF